MSYLHPSLFLECVVLDKQANGCFCVFIAGGHGEGGGRETSSRGKTAPGAETKALHREEGRRGEQRQDEDQMAQKDGEWDSDGGPVVILCLTCRGSGTPLRTIPGLTAIEVVKRNHVFASPLVLALS